MPIFDNSPNAWQDLQNRVGQLFTEIGCDVQIGTTVQLVRGEKEIDVLVRDPVTVPQSTYLCECKFWSTAIPKETVHGFRTVVGDYGAHRGYIISKVGFQAGAFAAAQNTNVELLTFDQLQAVFFDRWRVAMGQKYRPEADALFPYWDYPGKMPQFQWQQEHVDQQRLLIDAYYPLVHIGPSFDMQGNVWNLPMTLPALDANANRSGDITLGTYREVYDFIERNKELALRHFQILYGEVQT